MNPETNQTAATSHARPITVGIVSSERFTDTILAAKLHQGDFRCLSVEPHRGKVTTLRQLAQCDVLLKNFGAYSWGYLKLFAAAKALKKKVVVYWIGTDVLQASGPKRRWARLVQLLVDKNLTVNQGLRDELLTMGISADAIPIVGNLNRFKVTPLPEKFSVLTYLPDCNEELYGASTLHDVARRMPDVEFIAVGGDGADRDHPPNIRYLGFINDMSSAYRRTSALVRLTRHDGLPKMVLEALACGRNVAWTFPFPHCEQTSDVTETVRVLRRWSNSEHLNTEGADFVKRQYAFPELARQLGAAIHGLVTSSTGT